MLWLPLVLVSGLVAQTSVDSIVRDAERRGFEIGLEVRRVRDSAVVHRHGASRMLMPASNQKLITAAAFLHALGEDFRFTTEFWLRDGVLLAVAGGDPNWRSGSSEDPKRMFRRVMASLKKLGVESVRGVELDLGAFGADTRPEGWPTDQYDRDYCAPSCGLLLEGGCVRVSLEPYGPNALVRLVGPPSPHLSVVGSIRTTEDRRRGGIYRVDVRGETVRVSGHLWNQAQPREVVRALEDPARHFRGALEKALQDEGLSIRDDAPDRSSGVGKVSSSLDETLPRLLTESSNVDGEQLLRVLGAQRGDGSFEGGARAVRAALDDLIGGVPAGVKIADGSGLSRNNQVSADVLCRLLVAVRKAPFAERFVAALAVGGETGTLRRRFRDGLEGKVRAKTGTIRGVSALSGFVETDDGEVAFSILMNWKRSTGLSPRDVQDRIVRALAR